MAPSVMESMAPDLVASMQNNGNSCHICASLTATSVDQMLVDMVEAKSSGATCVELRLDYLNDFSLESLEILLHRRTLPAIVTFRPQWEGGLFTGSEENRLTTLHKAVELGADFVDIEFKSAKQFLESRPVSNISPPSEALPFNVVPTRIIVSSHNYESTPSESELKELVGSMKTVGGDIIKVATTASDISDVARVLNLIKQSQEPIIGITMGPKGQIGRILCPKYGAFATFGALAVGKESAIGQPTVGQLANVYKVQRIGPKTKVLGLIGNPVSHSKGYILHNALMVETGFDGIYVPYLVDDVKLFLSSFDSEEFAGFSVTIPHKQEALECAHHVDPVVRSIGAINTLVRRANGSLEGHNTDWDAAISAIEDGLRTHEGITDLSESPLVGRLVVVVGAGGAGRAIAFGAKQRGAFVAVANRSIDKAKDLALSVGGEVIPLQDLGNSDIVTALAQKFHGNGSFKAPVLANTTSVGMQPKIEETPVPKEGLGIYGAIFDAVYTPVETRLLKEGKEFGAVPVSGLEMFIRQAAKQFEFFTGLPDPRQLAAEIVNRL